jgi:hypothetical protein
MFTSCAGGRLTKEYLDVLRDSLVAGGRESLSPHTISSLLQEAVSAIESLTPTCASANSDTVEVVGGRGQAQGDASGASEIFDAPQHVCPIKQDLTDVVEAFVALVEACDLTRGSLSSSTAARVRQLLVTLNVSSTSSMGQSRVKSASAPRVSGSAHPLACTLESRVTAVISAVSTSISSPPPQRGTWKRTRNCVDSGQALQASEQEEGGTNGAKESKRGGRDGANALDAASGRGKQRRQQHAPKHPLTFWHRKLAPARYPVRARERGGCKAGRRIFSSQGLGQDGL